MTRKSHICCQAFGCGAVTSYFNILGLSLLGSEHQTFRLQGEHSNPLRTPSRLGKNFKISLQCYD